MSRSAFPGGHPDSAIARAEFTIYPFREGEAPPPHVQAAIEELREAGLSVEVTPFGQIVTGAPQALLEALRSALAAAVAAGATKAVVSIEVEG
jgi:uncharacterized protein YqgV (UPF0045/DUF77 family)